MRVRVAGEYPVGRVQVGPRGHAGRDEGDVGGPRVLLRLIEDNELVLVGVPVELPHHRVLEAAHHSGWQFNRNFLGLNFSLKNHFSFGLRFPALIKSSKIGSLDRSQNQNGISSHSSNKILLNCHPDSLA